MQYLPADWCMVSWATNQYRPLVGVGLLLHSGALAAQCTANTYVIRKIPHAMQLTCQQERSRVPGKVTPSTWVEHFLSRLIRLALCQYRNTFYRMVYYYYHYFVRIVNN